MKDITINYIKNNIKNILIFSVIIFVLNLIFLNIENNIVFNYFGIDIKLYDDDFSLTDVFLSVGVSLLILMIIHYFKVVFKNKNCSILIILGNLFIVLNYIKVFNLLGIIVNLGIILIIQYLIIKYVKKELYQNVLIILSVFLVITFFNIFTDITSNSYRIIGSNKAIIYSTDEYYITIDCTIDDDLTLYRGTQQKIETDSVYSVLYEFDSVDIE